MTVSYINTELFNERILIKHKYLNTKNIDNHVYNELSKKIEGKCYNNGYVIADKIEMINKTLGKPINVDSENYIGYNVRFKATLIQPGIDDIIECYINNVNKMGIIAFIKYKDIIDEGENNGFEGSPLLIIIPLQTYEDHENLNVGQKINVTVKAVRVKYNANKIQLVCEIVE